MLFVSVDADDCAVTGIESNINYFLTESQKRFNVTNRGLLKKYLGDDYKWDIKSGSKAFCKATMCKKVVFSIRKHEGHVNREAKVFDSLGKPHDYLSKNEKDEIDIDECRSLVCQLMFFTTKIGPKLGNETRALSSFMESSGIMHCAALRRVIGCLKSIKVKGILHVEPKSCNVIGLVDTDFGNCI